MAFAKTKQGKIYYEIHGSGTPVVLVRGLGRWSEHWNGWDKDLARHHQVIIFDGRGLGKTTVPIRLWQSMSDLASDIAAILRTENIKGAHILGVSLGGMIGLQLAIDHPELVLSVSPINTSVGRSGHLRITPEAMQVLMTAPIVGDKFYEDLARVLTAPNSSKNILEKVSKTWLAIDKQYPNPTMAVTSQLAVAVRWRDWESFSKIKAPINVMASDDDLFVPRGNSLFIASRAPTAILTQIPNSGHEPHLDQPEILLQKTLEFLRHVDEQRQKKAHS